ncbi:MAG: CehA/McbA family metallohydrolase [Ginsengibacter sp.]
MRRLHFLLPLVAVFIATQAISQHEHHAAEPRSLPIVNKVEVQPLLAQVTRLGEALSFLGSSLSATDAIKIKALQQYHGENVVKEIQAILDPYCLAMVNINPEAQVSVLRGAAKARLIQDGWTSFLIKVRNDAGVTAVLNVESPNSYPALHLSSGKPRHEEEHTLTREQVANRFLETSMYRNRPLQPDLSGLSLEYAVLQIYSKDAGKREAGLTFNIGQGTQDIGFRNAIHILFNIDRAVKVIMRISDDDGLPAMASFVIKDGIERVLNPDSLYDPWGDDYRTARAQRENGVNVKGLTGIYPLPSRRVAAYDAYPDFFFQAQIYRADGEYVLLPPGKYEVTFTRGPEYISQKKELVIPPGKDSIEVSFQLKRWINMAKLGWYSGDHHVHAAGCSHYESPEEGVPPMHMWRQIIGEDLNIGAVLTWGPGWYYQKAFFTGEISPLSTKQNIMRYDVEVSGFPSSHAGHLVLLRLKEDDYPGTTTIDEWPSWTLPVLKWAKGQGAVVGYAHSGLGLEPLKPTIDILNYETPKMDGIGANEYIVTVALDAVDFFSAGNTPAPWELNMWYHSLNCGFRTRLSGETDFPCAYDERVGIARSYYKSDSVLNFNNYADAIRKGRSYVSEGGSHIIDFMADEPGSINANSELLLNKPQTITIRAKVIANLPLQQDELAAQVAQRPIDKQPFWNIERARIGTSRKVPVELIVNGEAVDTIAIEADGSWKDLTFSYTISRSCWIALRVYPSSHTNPVFIIVNGKSIASARSAEWSSKAVDQCWKMKQSKIRQEDKAEAEAAYKKAKEFYDDMAKAAGRR